MLADDAGDDGELLVALADALAAFKIRVPCSIYETAIDRAQEITLDCEPTLRKAL